MPSKPIAWARARGIQKTKDEKRRTRPELASLPPVGGRRSADGIRFTAYRLRFTVCGLRFTANGLSGVTSFVKVVSSPPLFLPKAKMREGQGSEIPSAKRGIRRLPARCCVAALQAAGERFRAAVSRASPFAFAFSTLRA